MKNKLLKLSEENIAKQDKINHEEKHSDFTLECNELVQIKTKYSEKIDYTWEKHLQYE